MEYTPQYMHAQQYSYIPQYPYPAEQPWNARQPGYGSQGQNQWDAQQPYSGWQAPGYGGQSNWNMYEPIGARQMRQGVGTLWPDDLESLIAEEEYLPAAMPAAMLEPISEAAPPEGRQPSKAASLLLNILTFCFVGFLLAGSTIFAFSNSESKNLFGYRFYNVLTPSMAPFFKPGDMIFVKLTEPSQVKVGDVVTFSPSAKSTAFLTHRVMELLPEEEGKQARMITKGDYNNAADPPVGLNAVIGVHKFTIPFFGKVVDMMRSNLIMVCVCMGAVFLLLTVLRAYFAARKEEKKRAPALQPFDLQPFDIHAF